MRICLIVDATHVDATAMQMLAEHVCSPLLVPPDSAAEAVAASTLDEPAADLEGANAMIPSGTYACPMVYRTSFPLYWRLRPASKLLNMLAKSLVSGYALRLPAPRLSLTPAVP